MSESPRENRLRPILVADHIPAADGLAYMVFIDVDDVALRRAVPLLVAKSVAPSISMMAAFSIRLVEQP